MPLGLLFDIDGTLMDTLDAIVASMNAALESFAVKPLTTEELRPLIGMPVSRQMDLLRGMQGPVVDRITDMYYEHFMEHVEQGLPLYPGVRETMPRLGDHPISTMTTRRLYGARRMLEVSGIASCFTAIVGGDEVSRPKPYPDLPLYSARALGLEPGRCVVVGDAPVDILAGRAARMWTVAATYGYGNPAALREAKPHATIVRFAELPAVLEDLGARAPSP
ncbi:MAG TPA: HAD family hydrolase [Thermoplasmata archaeon]|nr:HAD family hydrolase [Thermoplasmata archaeon]